jgi:hypothetical protein
MRTLAPVIVLALSLPLAAQDKKPDQARIDAAIAKGITYLKGAESSGYAGQQIADCDELLLWTFVHAGVSESDARFQEFLQKMVDGELVKTYKVALQAMILEELDRVKHQVRIAQCAQFLVDNQCGNGQWSYGEPTPFAKEVPTGKPVPAAVASDGGVTKPRPVGPSAPRTKPKVVQTIAIRKMKEGPGEGDNSNSQYAALGLRSCHDAGIVLPAEVVRRARQWWRDSIHSEAEPKKGKPSVATGPGMALAEPAGWCYGARSHGHAAYGSMTAGAAGALTIYAYILGEKWKQDPTILSGLGWMARNFSVTENPGPPEWGEGNSKYMLYYYLYAMERACILFGADSLGGHRWYSEGAHAILQSQQADGSWNAGAPEANSTWETCFAILFLKRATRPLDVASEDRAHAK